MKPLFRLSPVFSDHMVFQAGKPVKLFGTCKKKAEIRVEWRGETIRHRADGSDFLIELPALAPSRTPFSFTVASKNQVVEITDCLAGDVIVCGGGSNMRYDLRDTVFETRPKVQPLIRFYEVPRLPYADAATDFPAIFKADTAWRECHKESALAFSAIGYYVGLGLFEETGNPVGIIACNHEDSSAVAWAGGIELEANPALAPLLAAYRADHAGRYPRPDDYDRAFRASLAHWVEWREDVAKARAAGISAEETARLTSIKEKQAALPPGPKHFDRPAGLFETMLATIVPFPVKAVLFYHGEADRTRAAFYAPAFRTVIRSWRRAFHDATLPFVFTQIAGYADPETPGEVVALLREAQTACIDVNDAIFMASAVDLGEERDPLPRDKREISRRLLAVLLEKVFRKGKNSGSPGLFSYQVGEGRLVVHTQYNNLNLVSRCGQNLGFTMVRADGSEVELDTVQLTGSQIVIRGVKDAREVRYCFRNYPHCDIYSANELPLMPFRIRL